MEECTQTKSLASSQNLGQLVDNTVKKNRAANHVKFSLILENDMNYSIPPAQSRFESSSIIFQAKYLVR